MRGSKHRWPRTDRRPRAALVSRGPAAGRTAGSLRKETCAKKKATCRGRLPGSPVPRRRCAGLPPATSGAVGDRHGCVRQARDRSIRDRLPEEEGDGENHDGDVHGICSCGWAVAGVHGVYTTVPAPAAVVPFACDGFSRSARHHRGNTGVSAGWTLPGREPPRSKPRRTRRPPEERQTLISQRLAQGSPGLRPSGASRDPPWTGVLSTGKPRRRRIRIAAL
ncbi:hypothetical protein J2850_005058 [Azospirillum picis]|uniref:Uncharacterized protein n=1 Tax=Azospirillum picis TaxID=488438 RepID=A0ABU0MRQ5_9PROT|nr:hypothetical protein [Azospirillum picis]MDQ0535904.1 hypothetical protein [Azospirillum picis]